MKNIWVKRLVYLLGILILLLVLANFGLNIWLKYKLPDYLKNKTDYIVQFKNLNVELGTGNISATDISLNSKNPLNTDVIGLKGTIEKLSISRFAMYDLLYHKRISSKDIVLSKPNLSIILATPKEQKTGKKRNPVKFENITIDDGNIVIYQANKQKFFSVKNLFLDVQNLQLTEEAIESLLPVVFDQYKIKGDGFFFRPDVAYAITAQHITTENGKMTVKKFQFTPLLSVQQFQKYFPNRNKLISFSADEMDFTDIILKNQQISLANMSFQNPKLKMFTSKSNAEKKEKKPNKLSVNLDNIVLKNAAVEIRKFSQEPVLLGQNIEVSVKKLLFDQKTRESKIPFTYADFIIRGNRISYFTDQQQLTVGQVAITPKSGDIQGIVAKPLKNSGKTRFDFIGNRLSYKLDNWEFVDGKLKIEAGFVTGHGLNGTILTGNPQPKKQKNFSGIYFPVKVRNIVLSNSNITVNNQKQPLVFKNLNLNVKNLSMVPKKDNSGLAFLIQNYSLTTRNFNYSTKFYNLGAGLVKVSKTGLQINNFSLLPKVSRSQFIRMIPTEKDLYTIKAAQISMLGNWDFLSDQKFLSASNITINQAHANIFRSKIPKDDPTIKPLYSELLRKIKFPLFIQNLNLTNCLLEYEEDTEKSAGPGKLTFTNFNLNAKNLNSGKTAGKPTSIPITVNCQFFGTSPMKVNWNMNTANMEDAFTIAGTISSLPANRINQFVEPYMKIRTTGKIRELYFNFKGNKRGIGGVFKMKHENLKVSVLKETGEKNKILSAVANIFVKTDSGNYPESVEVAGVERDPTKSFFNLLWKGIQDGLTKTLIGVDVKKAKESVNNTKQDVKSASQDVKNTAQNVKEKAKDVKSKISDITKPKDSSNKKNVFQKIFRKKEKAGN